MRPLSAWEMTMTTMDLFYARSNLTTRLARFNDRPNEWIDGQALAEVAGSYAWRTRVSDLRRAPFHMRIENRQRRVTRNDGSSYTISEYRFNGGVLCE
jgi:hypothetical protein